MGKILPFILTTAIGFGAGIYAGMWIKHNPPIAPPPASVLEEMKDAPLGSSATSAAATAPQNAMAAAAMDPRNEEAYRQIRTEMDDFRKKVDAIKSSLKSQMEPILTQEQRERMKRWRERPAPPPPPQQAMNQGGPPPPRGPRGFYEGFDSAITIIMVPFSLERMSDSLDLTPDQKESVRELLLERRAKFLELVDKTPPPSFKLIKLAPPEAKAAETAQAPTK